MLRFITKRLLMAIPLLFIMSFITFLFIYLTPGDVLNKYKNDDKYPTELIEDMQERYHFDKPFLVQYGYWLKNLVLYEEMDKEGNLIFDKNITEEERKERGIKKRLSFNLGYSFSQEAPVTAVIGSRLGNTLLLAAVSILITWLIAIPFGIYSAVHQYKWGDKTISVIAYLGISLPSFFLALLLCFGASIWNNSETARPALAKQVNKIYKVMKIKREADMKVPINGMRSNDHEELSTAGKAVDILSHMFIPMLVLTVSALASLQRIMRGNMLETLRQQYITTARAKGLSENKVIYKHALRNAINPLITIFGYQFSALLSGAALVEIITGWPGLGSLMLTAIRAQDTFLVMANMLMGGTMLIVGNIIADILLAYTDPRIKLS